MSTLPARIEKVAHAPNFATLCVLGQRLPDAP